MTAWGEEEVRRAWWRAVAWRSVFVLLGLGGLTGFVVGANVVAANSHELERTGTTIIGTVLEDSPRSLRCGQVQVPVAYVVESREYVEPLSIGGCAKPLSAGQEVALYVDPQEPTRFVSADSGNQSGGSMLAMVAGLVGGLVALVGGFVGLIRRMRARSVLRQVPYQRQSAEVGPAKSLIFRSARRITLREPSGHVLRLPGTGGDYGLGNGELDLVVAVGQDDRAVVAKHAGATAHPAKVLCQDDQGPDGSP